jgi:hypothetical protein
MKSYAHEYLDLREVCDYNQLDYGDVMDAICNSDISFGTNYDTLISQEQLQSVLDDSMRFGEDSIQLDFGKYDNTVVISLGS